VAIFPLFSETSSAVLTAKVLLWNKYYYPRELQISTIFPPKRSISPQEILIENRGLALPMELPLEPALGYR
jgi:hypothetical protein